MVGGANQIVTRCCENSGPGRNRDRKGNRHSFCSSYSSLLRRWSTIIRCRWIRELIPGTCWNNWSPGKIVQRFKMWLIRWCWHSSINGSVRSTSNTRHHQSQFEIFFTMIANFCTELNEENEAGKTTRRLFTRFSVGTHEKQSTSARFVRRHCNGVWNCTAWYPQVVRVHTHYGKP